MQAVILAAGMGKRLKSKTKEHTKSMVQFLGKTFLEHSLDRLTACDISRIIIVIGYCGDEIKKVIGNSYNGVPVFYVENEVYATTNNIYSLYLAKEYLQQEDTLLLESDLIYEKAVLDRLLENPYPDLAAVAKFQPYMDGTVVVSNEDDEIVSLVSKNHFDFREKDLYYKTVNIYKFSKNFLNKEYLPFLEAYCKTMGNSGYYEQVLKVLLSLEKNSLKVLKLDTEKWYEVDDLQDYDIAECLFCDDPEEKLRRLHSRYGGYWRFKDLKDFCYLVNPYFPSKKMSFELRNNFDTLMMHYPSGQSIFKLLAANIFGVKENYLLVGNGAAELINAFSQTVKGTVGVVFPTFQEYPVRFKNSSNVISFTPENPDFSYNLEDLTEFSKSVDTLVLVNPDNPSGNFLPKSDVLELLCRLKRENKKLVLDESFVDFTDEGETNTLISDEILEEFPNLTVIKSISKSYGVPGLRLGILASSDVEAVTCCLKNMPVWNINSFAEYFLQIFNKYKKDYAKSCAKIAENRNRLFEGLKNIPFLRPVKSQANYILCELTGKYSSSELCQKLLMQNILIKDCKNKLGFDGRNFVRIAVNSTEDNDFLVSVLQKL